MSERQTPQVVVFSGKLSVKGERLDRAFVRPRQACFALTDESMLCYYQNAGQGQLLWVGVWPAAQFGRQFSLVSMVSINLGMWLYGVETGDTGESIEPEESH